MITDLNILMLEDDPLDADLNKDQLNQLKEFNCTITWVITKEDFLHALQTNNFDLILSDYNLPQYDGLQALEDVKQLKLLIPFILVTGTLNEETAADTIKAGAWDYVVKDRLGRLPTAIRGALKLKEERTHMLQVDQFNQKLSMALKQSPSHILITDTLGIIEYVNPRFCEVTGYSEYEIIGHKPSILKSNFHNIEFYKNLWNTITAGKIWRGEFQNRKKDGSLFWESASISPLKNSDGIITHYVSVKEDITIRKQMENEIIQARIKAEQSDKLKTSFLQNMSHEIRTPLNAIIGFSNLLKEDDDFKTEREKFINIIVSNSYQLLSIVEDILTASRIETGEEKTNKRLVNINILLDNLYTVFKQNALKKDITLKLFKGNENSNFKIITDETKLTQILTNLLNNAVKFTYTGQIDYGYSIHDKELNFFVKDTGIGIEPENQIRIFEHFVQADPSISRNFGGTGLGLSITKSYVELLGGSIHVNSEPEKGSEFIFTIPFIED